MWEGRRRFTAETLALFGMGAVFLGVGVYICVSAYNAGQSKPTAPVIARIAPTLPPPVRSTEAEPALPAPYVYAPSGPPKSIFNVPVPDEPVQAPIRVPAPGNAPTSAARAPVEAFPERQTSPSVALGPSAAPLPPSRRPIDLNVPAPAVVALAPSASQAPGTERKTDGVEFGPKPNLSQFDHFTAVYDLMAHTVYLPDGGRLEAHSGLGPMRDDPSHVDQPDRGATPPHVYELTLREEPFHGVQALRLNPVGGATSIFGRAGLLAHTYMLGPGGDSNGCVSFKNYDAFLAAFQSGLVKKLAVVVSLNVAQR